MSSAPVFGYLALAPTVSLSVPSQQLPFVYTTTTVTDDLEEFTGPVYDQVHQEQFAPGETTENMVEIPVVQEQVIVQAIPEVVDSLRFNQVHHEHIAAFPAVTE